MILITILSLIGIVGAVYVARGRALAANCIWAVVNPGLALNLYRDPPSFA